MAFGRTACFSRSIETSDGPVAILQESWVKVGSLHFQDVLGDLEHLVWQHHVGDVAKVLVGSFGSRARSAG